MKREKIELAKYVDHTFLKPAGEEDAVRKLCREAKKLKFASVCVNPCEVPLAVKALKKSDVKVCTVVGFPLGANTTRVKCFEALDAIENGADELDFVINQRLLKYEPEACASELCTIVYACRQARPSVVLKLILECCNLTKDEIAFGCKLAKAAGFDFVKTSTGFGAGGATVEDVKLMRKTVGRKMGVKAAGGIRDRATALVMVAAGATRLGASAGLKLMEA